MCVQKAVVVRKHRPLRSLFTQEPFHPLGKQAEHRRPSPGPGEARTPHQPGSRAGLPGRPSTDSQGLRPATARPAPWTGRFLQRQCHPPRTWSINVPRGAGLQPVWRPWPKGACPAVILGQEAAGREGPVQESPLSPSLSFPSRLPPAPQLNRRPRTTGCFPGVRLSVGSACASG